MKTIEQKYRKLTDIEHVLLRPGMYVGSTNSREEEVYLFTDGSFVKTKVLWNPAFMKTFDEILSNSVDEHRRNPKLNEIRVVVNPSAGSVQVADNGGIPVVKHQTHDEWVPEMIFSSLKAGSNFDDKEERLVAGTNGVGSTLTNIFSLEFTVKTSDGKNRFEQTFRKNMTERGEAVVNKTRGPGYTDITFIPDLARFGMTEIDAGHVQIMRKRCLDLAACNPALRIFFNGEEHKFGSFKEYCALYSPSVIYGEEPRWKIGISPSEGSFTQVSFVNSVETRDGGTHVEYIVNQVVSWIREQVRKKHKIDLKPGELRNHFFVFVQSDIVNPGFSSQTKEKLITEPKEFGSKYEVSEKILKAVFASEVVQRILDWAQTKALADERRHLRDLNKNLSKGKVLKLIDAKARERSRCTLALFEGDSATSAFRQFRNPELQAAFPLRGKFLNVSERTNVQVAQNQEVKDLLAAIGLRLGEEPRDLRYGKILIYADADPDGDSITGLLVNFFGKYWPEMFEKRLIFRVVTPLVVCARGDVELSFYTDQDFRAWEHAHQKELGKWDIAYKKGLASLEASSYKEIIHNPKMFCITPGSNMAQTLKNWFGGSATVAIRKQKILGTYTPETEIDEDPTEGASEPTSPGGDSYV